MAKKQSKNRLGKVGRVEREQRLTRIIQTSLLAVLVVVAGVVAWGLFQSAVVIPNKVIATVYGQEITVGEFTRNVQYQRAQMVSTFDAYYEAYQQTSDPSIQQQYANVLAQYQYQLDPTTMGNSIYYNLISNALLIREAQARDIEVTEEEVLTELHAAFGYYPDGYPTFTPAPTYTPLPTDNANLEVPQPTPTRRAEPTSVTLEEYNQNLQDYLNGYEDYKVTFDEALLYRLIEVNLYREKLSDLLGEGISRNEDQVWAHHLLVEDEAAAQSLLDRLNAGESWDDLAAELLTDDSSDTVAEDLGWFTQGMMVQEFTDAAFAADTGDIVGPVETEYGFHIIEILGHEVRPLSDSDFDQRVYTALEDLLAQAQQDALESGDLVIDETWTKYIPTKPTSPYLP